jgi:hypothetical protein
VAADGLREPVPGQGGPGRVQQVEAGADPPAGDREPVTGDAASGDRLQPAQQGAEVRLARGAVEPAELDPGVAEPFGVRTIIAKAVGVPRQPPRRPLLTAATKDGRSPAGSMSTGR